MKLTKLLVLLPLLGAVPAISSCGGVHRTTLYFGQAYTDTVINLSTYEDLKMMVDNKENFILCVIPTNSCGCWTTFRDVVVNRYVSEKHISFYTIPYTKFYNGDLTLKETWGITISKSHQTLASFDNGSRILNEEYKSDNKIFTDYASFNTFMEERFDLPKYLYVDKTKLDSLYARSGLKFTIGYVWGSCDDCGYIKSHFLKDYYSQCKKTILLLDCDVEGIRYKDGTTESAEAKAQYQAFCDEYGLSTVNNSRFGYRTGKVPSFYYVNTDGVNKTGSVVNAAATYVNDVLTKDGDNYVVSDSFYSTERLQVLPYIDSSYTAIKGINIPASDVNAYEEYSYYQWKYECAATYHDPFVRAFFEYSIPNTSDNLF